MDSSLINNVVRRKRLKTLAALLAVFAPIFFRPGIWLAMTELLPRAPIRLGGAEISIPKNWMLVQRSARVDAWKPCLTILCGAAARNSFTLETSKLPVGSEETWDDASVRVIRREYSAEPSRIVVQSGTATWTCEELDNATPGGRAVAACNNRELRLSSSFFGDRSLKFAFYSVLLSARKI